MSNYVWIVLLPKLNEITLLLLWLAGTGTVWNLLFRDSLTHSSAKSDIPTFPRAPAILLVTFLFYFFLPTKTEMMQLKVLDIVSEIKGLKEIPQKAIDKLTKLLDEDEE